MDSVDMSLRKLHEIAKDRDSVLQSMGLQSQTQLSNWATTRTGLPWWLSGKEYVYQYKRPEFNCWSGKIPHAVGQLSPRTTTILSPRSRAHVQQQEKLSQWEVHTPQLEKTLLAATREDPCSNEDPGQPKLKMNKFFLKKNQRYHLSSIAGVVSVPQL